MRRAHNTCRRHRRMPTMLTLRAGTVALVAVLAAAAAGCSREQQDWRSAEAADTSEAYGRFVEQHPDTELTVQARTRIAQLTEEHDWAQAGADATADAYRGFLTQHPNGRGSEEARIRIEAFSLGSAPHLASPARPAGAASSGPRGGNALKIATIGSPPAAPSTGPQPQRLEPAPALKAERTASEKGAGNSGYGVQLGAFGTEASAEGAWRRLQGRFGGQLGGLSPRIVAGSGATGPLYRLQAPARDEVQARTLCATLKEQAQPCVPVLPH